MAEQIQKISLLISRLFAFLIDTILVVIISVYYFKIISVYPNEDFLRSSIAFVLLFQFYFFVFEFLFRATPGKFLFGLRINVSKKGTNYRINFFIYRIFNVFVRNFLRVLLFMPPLFILSEIFILIFYKGISFSEVITKIRVDFKSH